MRPIPATAASLPPASLHGGSLFLTALVGWSGFLVLTGHDPALAVGVRVAGVLTLLGMSVPGWLHAARVARAQRHGEWRRIRALVETRHLPMLAGGDGARLRDTLSLSLLAVMELPLPIYEAAIGVPGRGEAGHRDLATHAEPSRRTVDDPQAEESSAMGEHAGPLADGVVGRTQAA